MLHSRPIYVKLIITTTLNKSAIDDFDWTTGIILWNFMAKNSIKLSTDCFEVLRFIICKYIYISIYLIYIYYIYYILYIYIHDNSIILYNINIYI